MSIAILDMETHRKNSSSSDDETFSFPDNPNKVDPDFEFGCLTPHSLSRDQIKLDSPADHLFFNGKLLPHSFPTTRATSAGSKDNSSMSSRSNSTNSRSSSCSSISSARTSSSDNSEKKVLYYNRVGSCNHGTYGSSQRWQYLMPVPLGTAVSSRRRHGGGGGIKEAVKKEKEGNEEKAGGLWRFLSWFLLICRECHALETSIEDHRDEDQSKM